MAPSKKSPTSAKTSDKPVTPVTPPRSIKRSKNTSIKRVQAIDPRFSQQVDTYDTLVPELKITTATKPKDGNPEASFTFPMVRILADALQGEEYSVKWNILSVMGRRGVGDEIYRKSPAGSKWLGLEVLYYFGKRGGNRRKHWPSHCPFIHLV